MSKCKITGKVLVIRLGGQETQIAYVDSGKQIILESAILQTPEGAVEDGVIRDSEAVCEMLKEALHTPEFKNIRQVVFSLCTSLVIAETATTPDLPDAKLEKLLEANADVYFPVDMQDYHMVWQVVGPKKKSSELKEMDVQLWAVPNAILTSYYEIANSCGLSVAAIDYCGNSIAQAVGASFTRKGKASKEGKGRKKLDLNKEITFGRKKKQEVVEKEDTSDEEFYQILETELHLTLEKELLGMTFVQAGQVVFQRFIRCGQNPSYQFSEVAMMVDYFRSMEIGRSSEIRGIVSGTLCDDDAFVAELADVLGMNLSRFSETYASRWLICVGAAHTSLDFGDATLNKSKKSRKQTQSKRWQYVLLAIAAVCMVCVIMYSFVMRMIWDSEIKDLDGERVILSVEAQKTAGFADNYNAYSALYDSYKSDWETVFGSLKTYNDNLAKVLEELEDILPEKTSVTNIQITAEGLEVAFACETKEEAAYLIMALREFKYADLLNISNLSGGNRGAAISSSSDETPPTEGSGKETKLATYLDQPTVVNKLLGLAENSQLTYFTNSRYYFAPSAATLSGTRTPEQIKEALEDLVVNNPVSSEKFMNLVKEDQKGGSLSSMFAGDLYNMYSSGVFTGKTRQAQAQLFFDELLAKDSITPVTSGHVYTAKEKLEAADKLIRTDAELTNWYAYYLKDDGMDEYPYFNMDNIVKDLKNGGSFKTGDATVNEALDSLISQEARAYIDSLGEDDGNDSDNDTPMFTDKQIGEYLSLYLTKGTTNNATADMVINNYIRTGTTGSSSMDEMIESYIDSGAMDDEIGSLANKYMTQGSTGIPAVDDMLKKYFTTGTTGNKKLDARLDDYLDSGYANDEMSDLLLDYIVSGETNNSVFDQMLDDYIENGSTGNKKVDQMIAKYLAEDFNINNEQLANKEVEKMINDYISYGTTGNVLTDAMIEKYLTTGTTDNAELDKMLNDYIDAGHMDDEIKLLMDKYINTGTTGNPTLDKLIKNFYDTGTTGNERLDSLILNAVLMDGATGEDDINDLLNNLLGGSGTGSGTGDTRITFTVSLGYNEELKNEELNRKGLFENAWIKKLEVAQ